MGDKVIIIASGVLMLFIIIHYLFLAVYLNPSQTLLSSPNVPDASEHKFHGPVLPDEDLEHFSKTGERRPLKDAGQE